MQIRNALITGAGTRLGKAMALALAEDGFNVAVHYHSSAREAEAVAEEIRAMGQGAAVLRADLLDATEVDVLVPAAVAALGGPLTVLVNNASVFEYDRLETATAESWDRHIGSNLRAPFFLTQAFAAQVPETVADDRGEPEAQALVINMLDQRIRKLTPEFATYTIAKMGLWAFTVSLTPIAVAMFTALVTNRCAPTGKPTTPSAKYIAMRHPGIDISAPSTSAKSTISPAAIWARASLI